MTYLFYLVTDLTHQFFGIFVLRLTFGKEVTALYIQEYPESQPFHRYDHCPLIPYPPPSQMRLTVPDIAINVFGQEEQA
jgi:hypothetical protein